MRSGKSRIKYYLGPTKVASFEDRKLQTKKMSNVHKIISVSTSLVLIFENSDSQSDGVSDHF